MSGTSGKGTKSQETNSQVYSTNQQVATESGIAVGANSTSTINVQSSDPEVTKTVALAMRDVAGASIYGANDTAKALSNKFADNLSENFAQNVSLLQSLNQQQTNVALNSQELAKEALSQSFGVSRAVAPQDANYSMTELASTNSKTILYLMIGLASIASLFIFFRKKSA